MGSYLLIAEAKVFRSKIPVSSGTFDSFLEHGPVHCTSLTYTEPKCSFNRATDTSKEGPDPVRICLRSKATAA